MYFKDQLYRCTTYEVLTIVCILYTVYEGTFKVPFIFDLLFLRIGIVIAVLFLFSFAREEAVPAVEGSSCFYSIYSVDLYYLRLSCSFFIIYYPTQSSEHQ